MKKKTQSKHGPSLALALVAVVAPIMVGVMTTSAESSMLVAASLNIAPKSQQFSLFNAVQFRKLVREKHLDRLQDIYSPSSSSSSSSSTSSSSSSSSSVSSASMIDAPLRFEDLTSVEKETLLRQLRRGGCPYKADVRYRKLCEKMYKGMKHPAAMEGWKHPGVEQ